VGFSHAAFGPAETQQPAETGGISMLMVRQPDGDPAIAAGLLARSEEYLRNRGVKTILAGGVRPLDPFYLGLYGGSEQSGILKSDTQSDEFFRTNGYEPVGQSIVYHRDLLSFRPAVDRRALQVRRRCCTVASITDPPVNSWWEAWSYGDFDRVRFELRERPTESPIASVMFWNMEPMSRTWGVNAAGLVDLQVDQKQRRQAVATYMLGEAFRCLAGQGVTLVEAQAAETDPVSQSLFKKFGFTEVDRATRFLKS
jgi:ribosomal protein S18 acetylase RimI-like enzyme